MTENDTIQDNSRIAEDGEITFHPTDANDCMMTLNSEGLIYKGELAEDAGEALKKFNEYMELSNHKSLLIEDVNILTRINKFVLAFDKWIGKEIDTPEAGDAWNALLKTRDAV